MGPSLLLDERPWVGIWEFSFRIKKKKKEVEKGGGEGGTGRGKSGEESGGNVPLRRSIPAGGLIHSCVRAVLGLARQLRGQVPGWESRN